MKKIIILLLILICVFLVSYLIHFKQNQNSINELRLIYKSVENVQDNYYLVKDYTNKCGIVDKNNNKIFLNFTQNNCISLKKIKLPKKCKFFDWIYAPGCR